MDFATGLGVFLGLIALAVTVTPRITNQWVAYVAWLVVALYSVWFIGSRQDEVRPFVSQHRGLVGSGGVGLLLISLVFVRLSNRRARQVAAEAEATKQRAFDNFPVEPGIVDHGVNTKTTLEAAMQLLHRARPAISRIYDQIYKDTPNRLPSKRDPDFAMKQQTLLREAAGARREDVLLLEEVAADMELQARALVDAHRAVIGLPIRTEGDVQKLREMKVVFSGATTTAFQQCADVLRARSRDITKFNGMQQDLTRVVTRTVAAMDRIAVAAEGIAEFYSVEMPNRIERVLEVYAADHQ